MVFNLDGWRFVLTIGYDLDIYAKGNSRVGIDRKTGKVIIKCKGVKID